MTNKGVAHIALVFLVVAIGVLALVLTSNDFVERSKEFEPKEPISTSVVLPITEPENVDDWDIIINEEHSYQLAYPLSVFGEVDIYSEGHGNTGSIDLSGWSELEDIKGNSRIAVNITKGSFMSKSGDFINCNSSADCLEMFLDEFVRIKPSDSRSIEYVYNSINNTNTRGADYEYKTPLDYIEHKQIYFYVNDNQVWIFRLNLSNKLSNDELEIGIDIFNNMLSSFIFTDY